MVDMTLTFHAATYSDSNDVGIVRSGIVIQLDELVAKATDPDAGDGGEFELGS